MSAQAFVPITVHAAGIARHDAPVEVTLETELMAELMASLSSPNRFGLIEIDDAGASLDRQMCWQVDLDDDGSGHLTFLLPGKTPADATRRFQFSSSQVKNTDNQGQSLVTIIDHVMHEEQESYRIETPAATYLYHKIGAGFASMIDPNGADWLSYQPWGGSDGVYRGIPNLAYPESNFHPGNTESTSRIVANGPVKATIRSETNDGKWACQWDIFPHFARLTVLRVGHPYWFLYEGTPGGKLDEAGDYVVRSPGVRTTAAERWNERLPSPRWIYFGAANSDRVLYLVHHEDDGETDSYWPMEGNMTVFGFGRLNLNSSLEQVPARFTIGLTQEPDDGQNSILGSIESAVQDIVVEVEALT